MTDIVHATREHWSQVREIRLRALSADPAAFGQSWDTESAYDESRWIDRVESVAWFLALDDGSPVGVVASRHESDAPESERELQAMWVQSDFRRRGLAQELAEAVFEWARGDGASSVALYIHPGNQSAITLYEGLGFSDTGSRWKVDEDDPTSDWIKMARAL